MAQGVHLGFDEVVNAIKGLPKKNKLPRKLMTKGGVAWGKWNYEDDLKTTIIVMMLTIGCS